MEAIGENTNQRPVVTLESRVELRDLLVVRHEGQDPVIGDPTIRSYVEVGEEGVAAIDAIRETANLREAQALLKERTGETYDVVDLVDFLAGRSLIRVIDDDVREARGKPPAIAWLRPERVAWMHHPLTLATVLGVIALGTAVAFVEPATRPSFSHVFALSSPSLSIVLAFALMAGNAFVHEFAHLGMARSFGVDGALRVSHRLYLLVLVSDVTNAWTRPRRERMHIYLAGIGYNALAWAVVTIALGVAAVATPGFEMMPMIPLLRLFGLLNLIQIAFQLLVWARTDLYFVLQETLNERNLRANSAAYATAWIQHGLDRMRGRLHATCPTCGHGAQRTYSFCLFCGTPRADGDPNRFSFRHEARGAYLAYAGILIVAGPLTLILLAYILFVVQWRLLLLSFSGLTAALGRHAPVGELTERAGAFTLLTLQFAFLVSLAGGRAARFTSKWGATIASEFRAMRASRRARAATATRVRRVPRAPAWRRPIFVLLVGLLAVSAGSGGSAAPVAGTAPVIDDIGNPGTAFLAPNAPPGFATSSSSGDTGTQSGAIT